MMNKVEAIPISVDPRHWQQAMLIAFGPKHWPQVMLIAFCPRHWKRKALEKMDSNSDKNRNDHPSQLMNEAVVVYEWLDRLNDHIWNCYAMNRFLIHTVEGRLEDRLE